MGGSALFWWPAVCNGSRRVRSVRGWRSGERRDWFVRGKIGSCVSGCTYVIRLNWMWHDSIKSDMTHLWVCVRDIICDKERLVGSWVCGYTCTSIAHTCQCIYMSLHIHVYPLHIHGCLVNIDVSAYIYVQVCVAGGLVKGEIGSFVSGYTYMTWLN